MRPFDAKTPRRQEAQRRAGAALFLCASLRLCAFASKKTCLFAVAVLQFGHALAIAAPPPGNEQRLAILPGDFELHGPEARQRIIVGRFDGARFVGQASKGLELKSGNDKVVKIRRGVAVPVANGEATLSVEADGLQHVVRVKVTGHDQPHAWSFRNHVEPVMARFGCSTGACHGALAGKGGFKLSLLGYNPAADHEAITRQARGRRIELTDPGRSLFLTKPTAAVRHKGGIRFEVDSREYRALSQWIASGAPAPTDNDPRLARLEVLPQRALLKPGDEYQLLVRAHFTDGRVEDVTDWIRFSATNEAVAKVDPQGKVTIVGHGEGAVTAWYLSRIVIANVTVPYLNQIEPAALAAAPRRNFIDEMVLAKLAELRLPPSPRCSDVDFLRRASIDTIGTLPTAAEAKAFLADPAPDKRDRLIESLLSRPEFVDYWSYKWSDVMLISGKRLRPPAVKAFYEWIHKNVEKNTPWDEMVRQVLTAQGSSHENGATNFYAIHQLPEEMTENVSQAFLSLSIGCARCHNHPLEKWTNDQYYAMANLFARVRAKGWGGDTRLGDGLRTLYVADSGELVQPATGKPRPPTPLDAEPLPFDTPQDRREYLARWLTAPDNPYFARAITNRVWANFFGVGLVEKVDDLRMSNPASNEPLLSAAADYLVQHKFDLKALMRVILQSEAYQRSSEPLAENRDEGRFYSRYYPRRMMAEVLLDAIVQVTGVPDEFKKVSDIDGATQDTKFYPAGTRALQLYDAAIVSPFLKTFGRNEREVTCECARTNEPSIVQVLHLTNGGSINEKLAAKKNRLTELLAADHSDVDLLDQIYLGTLARYPTEKEREGLLRVLAETRPSEKRQAVEDIYWGVLTSREFLFNH